MYNSKDVLVSNSILIEFVMEMEMEMENRSLNYRMLHGRQGKLEGWKVG